MGCMGQGQMRAQMRGQKGSGSFSRAIRQGVKGTHTLSLNDVWISEWTEHLAPNWPLPNETLGGKHCIISRAREGQVERGGGGGLPLFPQ
jgi:hypothetical protein